MPPFGALSACRSCRHLGRRRPRGKPVFEIGNELFGIAAVGNGVAAFAKPTHGLDIGRDLARLAHRLRIIGGEDELRQRYFLQAEAHPVFAEFGGVVRTGLAGDVVIQALIEVMIKRRLRPAAVARQLRCAKLLARLKAADAAAVTSDAASKMRELNLQAW